MDYEIYLLKHIKTFWKYMLGHIITRTKAIAASISLKVFTSLYERSWTGVQFVVHQEAQRVGREMLKGWLRHNRISHCARCLAINVTFRKTIIVENDQTVYLCEPCLKSGQEAKAVRPALDLVKP